MSGGRSGEEEAGSGFTSSQNSNKMEKSENR